METLTSDTVYEVASRLNGEDLVRYCATNSRIRQVCKSSKFDSLWRRKLAEDFNIHDDIVNPYREYMYNSRFYKQSYYLVTDLNEQNSLLFRTREEAIKYIKDEFMAFGLNENDSREYIDNALNDTDRVSYGDISFAIDLVNFKI